MLLMASHGIRNGEVQHSHVVDVPNALVARGAEGDAHACKPHSETAMEPRPHQPLVRQRRAARTMVHSRIAA